MAVTPDGVVQGGVVSNRVTGVEGLVTDDGVKTLPEGVLGGPGVLTAAQLGGLFLPGPLIKQGVKRRRGNVPIAFSTQSGQVFKEQNRKLHVDRSQRRIRAAESQDPGVRKKSSKSATTEERRLGG